MKRVHYKNASARAHRCIFLITLGRNPLKLFGKADMYAQPVKKFGVSASDPGSFVCINPCISAGTCWCLGFPGRKVLTTCVFFLSLFFFPCLLNTEI